MLPALGIALVKPCVVGTTARASKENVRSIGYSIYYTLVNIGGAAGPYLASWIHQHMRVENVFRAAAISVFAMFFAVLLFFKEPRRSGETQTVSFGVAAKNFLTVISNPRFMIFLLIFSGYWIVYWQEFIILPIYIHDYINPRTTELILVTGPLTVISLQLVASALTPGACRVPRHHAGHADLRAGLDHSDRPPDSADGDRDSVRGFARRDHAIPALLRIYFTPRPSGQRVATPGFAQQQHRHRLVDRRLVRRSIDAPLRRSNPSAAAHLVGRERSRRSHRGAVVGL